MQFAASGQQIAQTFPLINARIFGFSPIGPLSEHHKKVRRSTKGSVQVQVQPTPRSAMKSRTIEEEKDDLFATELDNATKGAWLPDCVLLMKK